MNLGLEITALGLGAIQALGQYSFIFIIRTNLKPANNKYYDIFSFSKLILQITNGFVYATLSFESAYAQWWRVTDTTQ